MLLSKVTYIAFQGTHFLHSYQFMLSLGIEPTTLALHADPKAGERTCCNTQEYWQTHHTVVQAHAGLFKRNTQFNSHYFYSTLHNTDHFNTALQERPDLKIIIIINIII